MTSLAFIGGGAMGGSIVRRLIGSGTDPSEMLVVDLSPEIRADYEELGVATSDDVTAVVGVDVVVVAVKPQHLTSALDPLSGQLSSELIVSVVAGVPTRQYEQQLGPVAVVRCMPNTPALIGLGMTALAAGEHVTADQFDRAKGILSLVGATVGVDEADLDAVTAVSGSGPAYVFLLAESMMAAAREQGLSEPVAKQLVEQTLVGASQLLADSDDSPDVLRVRVTSPGGTTQEALGVFESEDFRGAVSRAIAAAARRSKELGDQ